MRNRLYISGFLLDIGGTKNCCYYGKILCEMIIKENAAFKSSKEKSCKYTSKEREREKKNQILRTDCW